ncbi:MAG: nucleotidyltransferase family protein [Anaerolineae bacterium]|nr:nucleotidyltransferase family protein [Anaerolineae bacterium]
MQREEKLDPTQRLFFACVYRDRGDAAGAPLDASLTGVIDWNAFLKLARYHDLAPWFHWQLHDIDTTHIPASVKAQLKSAFYTNLLRNTRLQAALAQIATALHENGIEGIVLKGGALAPTVYASLALRTMGDLDLMVRQEDVAATGVILETLGFHMSGSVPPRMVTFQQRFGGGISWTRPEGDAVTRIDVQHHIIGVDWFRDAAVRMPAEALWQASRPLDVISPPLRQLSEADMLVHLCVHPALHHGYAWALNSYLDIDRVIANLTPAFSWDEFVERVEQFRARTVVGLGLQMTHTLLGTPAPQDVLDTLAPQPWRKHLLARLAGHDAASIIRGGNREVTGIRHVLLHLMLVDRGRDALAMVARILFPTNEWLRARYDLDSKRSVLQYRWTHPLRILRAGLRGLTRKLVQSGLE